LQSDPRKTRQNESYSKPQSDFESQPMDNLTDMTVIKTETDGLSRNLNIKGKEPSAGSKPRSSNASRSPHDRHHKARRSQTKNSFSKPPNPSSDKNVQIRNKNKPDLFKKNKNAPSHSKSKISDRSQASSPNKPRRTSNRDFGQYYKDRNNISTDQKSKLLVPNKYAYRKNMSEGGLCTDKEIKGMNALEKVQFFLKTYWAEPLDLLQMYKRNAIMHAYIKD
jgi:hypothetical protein